MSVSDKKENVKFSPSLCLTHRCNLNCIYCYQNHDDNNRMSFDTACSCVDWIFENVPSDMNGIEISFIGGEPLLEFDLIKKIVDYTNKRETDIPYIFYATTNGTVLTEEMKTWFYENRNQFVLGLSLDGLPETHNHNRSNSFDKIDVDYFVKTWPNQGIKMTLSEFSLKNLADNIIFLHSCGFKEIGGVNLFEGEFDWSQERFIKSLIPQLKKLVEFYVENDNLPLDQMLGRQIDACEEENKPKRKWCGIGSGVTFFDTDGTKLPCPFVTPMTFEKEDLYDILKTDFENPDNFIDEDCFENCYIYPICPHCAGANYLSQKTFKKANKSKCRIQKLVTLFCADLHGKRLLKNPNAYDEYRRYHLINAIEKIRESYLSEFLEYKDLL